MKTSILYISLLIFLFSCGQAKYKYWDLSKFKMKPDALRDGEPVKMIYTSQAPTDDQDRDYYICVTENRRYSECT